MRASDAGQAAARAVVVAFGCVLWSCLRKMPSSLSTSASDVVSSREMLRRTRVAQVHAGAARVVEHRPRGGRGERERVEER